MIKSKALGVTAEILTVRPKTRMQFGVNHGRRGNFRGTLAPTDSPNSLLFACSRARHAERLDLVITDTCRRSN
jgi:hypothetical protein